MSVMFIGPSGEAVIEEDTEPCLTEKIRDEEGEECPRCNYNYNCQEKKNDDR